MVVISDFYYMYSEFYFIVQACQQLQIVIRETVNST
jgi:hypothetical protein